ncbi:MAG: protein-disulfide reductase DsbD family protein [Opitutales bacterium]|nr:protein-disulfide reductase DsbD family protein [Opitutales bacterium]
MRKVLSLIFSVLFPFSLPSVFGVEGDILDKDPTQHSLVADVVACNGKDSFEIAWRIRRQSGWHTYWLHPGDVGIPPSITWELPEGVTTTPLIFPAPKRVMMGEVGAHGHHGETLFLSKISFSDSFTPGDNLTIRGKAAWLTCSQTCLPGFGELVLSLPIQPNNQADPVWSARFAQFRAVLPVSPPDGWQALAYDEGSKLRMVLPAEPTASSPGVYFFSEGRTIKSDAMQPVRVKGGQWELQMTRSAWSSKQETHLRGLLYRKAGWQGDPACQFYQVSLPLAKK